MDNISYPDKKNLFRPSKNYPEYQEKDIAEENNDVYEAVRQNFHLSLTVKVVVSKIYIFCSCRSSDIVLYLT